MPQFRVSTTHHDCGDRVYTLHTVEYERDGDWYDALDDPSEELCTAIVGFLNTQDIYAVTESDEQVIRDAERRFDLVKVIDEGAVSTFIYRDTQQQVGKTSDRRYVSSTIVGAAGGSFFGGAIGSIAMATLSVMPAFPVLMAVTGCIIGGAFGFVSSREE